MVSYPVFELKVGLGCLGNSIACINETSRVDYDIQSIDFHTDLYSVLLMLYINTLGI